jgi:hypothetical protein
LGAGPAFLTFFLMSLIDEPAVVAVVDSALFVFLTRFRNSSLEGKVNYSSSSGLGLDYFPDLDILEKELLAS